MLLYNAGLAGTLAAAMDKFWSICSMPIGVFLCFSPVLVAWVITASKKSSDRPKDLGKR
jgi:hypothetical protein